MPGGLAVDGGVGGSEPADLQQSPGARVGLARRQQAGVLGDAVDPPAVRAGAALHLTQDRIGAQVEHAALRAAVGPQTHLAGEALDRRTGRARAARHEPCQETLTAVPRASTRTPPTGSSAAAIRTWSASRRPASPASWRAIGAHSRRDCVSAWASWSPMGWNTASGPGARHARAVVCASAGV
uniref:hypothetical protein n=1 Tax=Streptomyces cellulosae TaxID=1968 RepID=UPI002F90D419